MSYTHDLTVVGRVSVCQDATLNFTCYINVYSSASDYRQFSTCTQVRRVHAF